MSTQDWIFLLLLAGGIVAMIAEAIRAQRRPNRKHFPAIPGPGQFGASRSVPTDSRCAHCGQRFGPTEEPRDERHEECQR